MGAPEMVPLSPLALGPYAATTGRNQWWGRSRRTIAAASVALALVIGLASFYVAVSPAGDDGRSADAVGTPSTPAPTEVIAEVLSRLAQPVQLGSGPGGPELARTPLPEVAGSSAALAGSTAGTEAETSARVSERGTTTGDEVAAATPLTSTAADATGVYAASASRSGETSAGSDATPRPGSAAARSATDAAATDAAGRGTATEATAADDARDLWRPRNEWVCDGRVRLQDPVGRSWAVRKVTLSSRPSFDTVTLHLVRTGLSAASPTTMVATALPTSRLRSLLPAGLAPARGRTTARLDFSRAVSNVLDLDGYRPSGVRWVRELSLYRAAGGRVRALVSADSDGCFRVRAPAWSEGGANARSATISLDIRS
jgi:hypothetical protein